MARGKKYKPESEQPEMFDVTGRLITAPCVPPLREAVKSWRAGGYKGVTDTTRKLLNHWFYTDNKSLGKPFKYHLSQQEAMETLIFVWEVEKVRNRSDLLQRYASNDPTTRLPVHDNFARYCVKMATGTGKTKVMSLAIVWQYMNAARESEEIAKDYAKTFLVIAPNVIVYERLKTDFAGERIFTTDPLIPKPLQVFWDFSCVIRGEGEKAYSEGMLFLTNIQQLYERPSKRNDDEPEEITDVLGSKPPVQKLELSDFPDRIGLRDGLLMIINDEAHHTHDEENEWNKVIQKLNSKNPLAAQLDFSATPRFQKGAIFPWTISDYPLKQAIIDGIVKRPMKGVANISEAKSNIASVRYKGFLTASVERWREYKEQLAPLKKKPILFIMLSDTKEADEVGEWLREKYPSDFLGDKTLVIHTDKTGEVSKKDLDEARDAARNVDYDSSPINAIVSVLMLREGWDVQNVTVVVGLRPYSSKANILPEQTIGRGLRLMFRGLSSNQYVERVDIIGNDAFLEFVDDLEKLEDLKLDKFALGKEKLKIVTIMPMEDKKEFDIGIPVLSPVLVRKKSLAEEIAGLSANDFQCPPLPIKADEKEAQKFIYEAFDIVDYKKVLSREYTIPEPQTPQEVIGYYARRIAEDVRLPSQFAVLAPLVRDFFENKAFGKKVNLEDREIINTMNADYVCYVVLRVFGKVLKGLAIEEPEAKMLEPDRMLSTMQPIPWSRPVWEGRKCVLNLTPCDNDFEREFARFLDNAKDVKAFCKLPESFGFAIDYLDPNKNLRAYYPDFVAIAEDNTRWLIETKGFETAEVAAKDQAAINWSENASALTGNKWQYIKVPQKEYEGLRPKTLGDLKYLQGFDFGEK